MYRDDGQIHKDLPISIKIMLQEDALIQRGYTKADINNMNDYQYQVLLCVLSKKDEITKLTRGI